MHEILNACKELNLTPPDFNGAKTQKDAQRIMNEFKELAKNKFRQLIKLHHPDKGGDRAKAEKIIKAMDIIKQVELSPPRQPMITVFYYTSTVHSSSTTTGAWGTEYYV